MIGKKDAVVAKVTDFGLSGLSSVMTGRAVVNPGIYILHYCKKEESTINNIISVVGS